MSKSKMLKRILSFALALLVAFGLIPQVGGVAEVQAKELAGGVTTADNRIAVIKTLDGEQPGNKVFTFELYNADENGNAVGSPIQTAKNGPKGNAIFNAISYNAAGTYNYVVKEVNDNQDGIVYDSESEKKVQVVVTSSGSTGETGNTEASDFPSTFTQNHSDWGENTDVRIEGPIVKDESGAVIEKAQVSLVRKSSGAVLYQWLSDNGGVGVKLMNGETYILRAAKNGYSIADQEFTVNATTTTNEGATGVAANWETYDYSKGNLWSEKEMSYGGQVKDVVYCINRGLSSSPKDFPKRIGRQLDATLLAEQLSWNTSRTTQVLGSDMPNGYLDDTNVPSGYDAETWLKRVLWNGYPNNANGKAYSYESTQRAVFAIAHAGKNESKAKGSAYLGNDSDAYELWSMAINNTGKEVPAGFNVNLYVPIDDTKGQRKGQSFIGGRFHGGSAVSKYTAEVSLTGKLGASQGGLTVKAETVTFANTTKKDDEPSVETPKTNIEGTKTLTGKTLEDGQFTFQLIDETGKVLQEKKNDAQGNIAFDEIEYFAEDMGDATEKTFTYKVKEVNDGQANIKYDSEEKTVTVKVTAKKTTTTSETPAAAGETGNTEASDFPSTFTQNHSDWGENTDVRIEGPIVKDESGAVIEKAQVSLVRKSSGAVLYQWLSDNGGVGVKLMNGETYILRAAKNGYSIADQEFTVNATTTTNEGATGVAANWETYDYSKGNLWSEKEMSYGGQVKDVVYCINRGLSSSPKDFPKRIGRQLDATLLAEQLSWNTSRTTQVLGSDMPNGYLDDTNVPSGYDAETWLKRVLWNGYPNNANGKAYSYESTQRAVFAIAHAGKNESKAKGSAYLGNDSDAYELWSMAINNTGKEVPAGFNVNLYVPIDDTKGQRKGQSFIGGRFHGGSAVSKYTAEVSLTGKLGASQGGTEEVTTIEIVSVEAGTFAFENKYEETEKTPEIGTTATDAESNDTSDKSVAAKSEAKIKDVIEYKNLKPNTEYTVEGSMHKRNADGSDGGAVDGTYVVEGTEGNTFTSSADGNGTVTVIFTVDTTQLAGETLVAFEEVKENGETVAVHAEIGDAAQSVEVENPGEVSVTITGKKVLSGNGAPTNIKDMFQFGIYDADGNLVTSSGNHGMRKTNPDGSIYAGFKLTFTEEGTYTYTIKENKDYRLAGADYSCISFDAEDKTVEIVVTNVDGELKAEVNGTTGLQYSLGEFQNTFSKPEIGTTATDKADGDKIVKAEEAVQVRDIVKYSGLIAGREYTLTGKLVTKSSNGETVVATNSKKFTPEAADGEVELVFTLNASELAGEELVAFETVSYNSKDVAVHADINDEAQTVEVETPEPTEENPEIGTTATDNADGDKTVDAGSVEVKDVVKYSGLIAGREYTLTGKLVTKSSAGRTTVASNSKTFKPEAADGEVDLVFTVNASELAGEKLVAFETVSYNGNEVAVHADINDADQTVEVETPDEDTFEIKIKKTDLGGQEVPGAKITVTGDDFTSTWTSTKSAKTLTLKAGSYTMEETVAPTGYSRVETTIDFTVDEEGNVSVEEVTQDITTTTTTTRTEVQTTTTLDEEGNEVIIEEEVEVVDTVEETETVVMTSADGDTIVLKNALNPDEEPEEPVEEEEFEINISKNKIGGSEIAGAKMTVEGDGYKETWTSTKNPHVMTLTAGDYVMKEVVAPAGYEPVTTEISFTVSADGTVTLNTVEVDGGGAISANGNHITLEDAPKDEPVEQEEDNPSIGTTAVDNADGDKTIKADKVQVKDIVKYSGLVPNREYTLTGQLVTKASNGEIVVANAETTFTPKTTSGSVALVFDVNASELEGEKLVAFETVTYNGKEIATHTDINDEDQTVEVEKPEEPETPEEPTPEEPETPEEPTPEEPETPDEPTPEEPETPDEPTPEEPETPDEPTPEEPTNPNEPEEPTPEVPETPDEPTPEEPTNPNEPEEPTPEVPTTPGEPEEPTPDIPSTPGKPDVPTPTEPTPNIPSTPGKPTTPTTPTVPNIPSTPGTPTTPNTSVPKTGDTNDMLVWFGLLAAAGLAVAVTTKRRAKNN